MSKQQEELRKNPLKECSEDFIEAIRENIGSIRGTCEFCGVTYFDESAGHYDEGELEELKQQEKDQPDLFKEQDGGVSFCRIEGLQYIMGCPCNGPRRYEDWIWGNRWMIAEYLKTRATTILKNAEEFAAAAGAIHVPEPLLGTPSRRVENEDPNRV